MSSLEGVRISASAAGEYLRQCTFLEPSNSPTGLNSVAWLRV
jgi:hypothetical protein